MPNQEERVSETRTEADEFEDRDPEREVTVAMIQGEPAVVCWRERDVEVALAADMGLPVDDVLVRRRSDRLLSGRPRRLGGGAGPTVARPVESGSDYGASSRMSR